MQRIAAKIFTVIWSKLVTWHVPDFLRMPVMLAFIKALVIGINDLHTRFLTFRSFVNYQLSITPQVCYMEKALNDKYDTEQRRITIVDASENLPVVLWMKAENKPKKLYTKVEGNPVTLFTKGETAQFTVDFIVKVPVFVDFDINEMTQFVNSYRLPGRTFKIMIF